MEKSSVEFVTQAELHDEACEFLAVLSPNLLKIYVWILPLLVVYIFHTRYFTGIRHIPGPFLASFSNFWKMSAAWHEDMPRRNIALHRKYGKLVRIGPDMISVDDPGALSTIYGIKPIYAKTALFPIVEALYKEEFMPHLFTTRCEKYHAHLKRSSISAFSLATLSDLEQYVHPVIDLLLQRIEEIGEGGMKPIDIGTWLQYFTFDALGEINFGERFGFLETGTDVGKNISTVDTVLKYFSIVGQAPWLHKLLLGNPLVHRLLPLESSNTIQNFAISLINKRCEALKAGEPCKRDILARLLEVSDEDETKLSLGEIIALTTANLIAGSDSTAIALRAILYFLCRSPVAYAKLQNEIDNSFAAGAVSIPVRYEDGAKLCYLNAVITEALRAHAAVGFVLEREVPPGGVTIAGQFIPAGTIVGINPWVMHANKSVYGEDAETFNPERWFGPEEKVKEMKRCNMTFGAGPRVCTGRNITMMEIVKFIPTLMRMYDFHLANPDKEWRIRGHWFTKQSGGDMVFMKRNLTADHNVY